MHLLAIFFIAKRRMIAKIFVYLQPNTNHHSVMNTNVNKKNPIMKRILSTAGWLVTAAVLTMGTAACSTNDDNDDNALPEPSVTAQARTIDLATLTADFTFVNGDVLTGTLDGTT